MNRFFKYTLIAIVVFVLLGVIAVNSPADPPTEKADEQTADSPLNEYEPSQPKVVSYIAVSPMQLINTYEANEVAADEKYKDKSVSLTGTVDKVGKDQDKEAYMTFKTPSVNTLTQVQCYFKYNQLIDDLRPGDKVKITGIVTGKTLNILLKDCELK